MKATGAPLLRGMRGRLGVLLCALAGSSGVITADEPTSALDPRWPAEPVR